MSYSLLIIKGRFLLIFLFYFSLQSCHNIKPKEQENDLFWSHKFHVVNDVSYVEGGNEYQKLDLYLQGEYVGEPLYVKTDTTPQKTLIYIHGGGWATGDKVSSINYFLHFIEKGWNVVSVNYTLAKDGENAAGIPGAVSDVQAAMKWISINEEKYSIDLNNVVLGGESAGGQLSLITGLLNSNSESNDSLMLKKVKIKAIINWFGVVDIEKFFHHIIKVHQNSSFNKQESDEIALISKKYSPINFVSKNTPPVITIHGSDDTVVPVQQAYNLHKELDKYNVRNKLIVFERGKHVGFKDSQWKKAFKAIFEFIN